MKRPSIRQLAPLVLLLLAGCQNDAANIVYSSLDLASSIIDAVS